MELKLFSTEKIVTLNGIPARIWEGETPDGIRVHVYITRVAIDCDEPRYEQFERELEEHRPCSPELWIIPSRLIL
jgi:hypothetical protein